MPKSQRVAVLASEEAGGVADGHQSKMLSLIIDVNGGQISHVLSPVSAAVHSASGPDALNSLPGELRYISRSLHLQTSF